MPRSTTANQSRKKNAPASKEISAWLRDRIRKGRFVPGQRLVEADIIAETGATRIKVREALQRLATEGLVEIEEFRGASVKRFTPAQIRQIYRARMALEGLAAAEFAAADLPELKQRLVQIQKEMDAWEDSGGHDRFAELNNAWHELILEGAGNDYIRQFISYLTVPIYRLLFSTFYTKERIQLANADHRLITTAIVEGRVDDAERAMRSHISDGLEALAELDSHF